VNRSPSLACFVSRCGVKASLAGRGAVVARVPKHRMDAVAEKRGLWERWASRLTPRAREEIAGYLFISPWIVGFLVFTAGAMVASLVLSLFKTNMLQSSTFVGLRNYANILLHDELARRAFFNTAYYSFATVPLGTALALVIALLLNQGVKAQGLFRTIYYLPSVVSGVAVAIVWAWMFHPDLGLINGVLAKIGIEGPRWIASEEWAMPAFIVMSMWGTGGSMLIFLAGLQSIPTALYEAARIDGANAWQRFWNVTIPMLTPTIFFSIIMGVIGSWQVFTQAYVMTSGGPNNATLTVVLLLYRKAFQAYRFGYSSALAWVLFCVILVFSSLIIKSSAVWVYYEGEVKK